MTQRSRVGGDKCVRRNWPEQSSTSPIPRCGRVSSMNMRQTRRVDNLSFAPCEQGALPWVEGGWFQPPSTPRSPLKVPTGRTGHIQELTGARDQAPRQSILCAASTARGPTPRLDWLPTCTARVSTCREHLFGTRRSFLLGRHYVQRMDGSHACNLLAGGARCWERAMVANLGFVLVGHARTLSS